MDNLIEDWLSKHPRSDYQLIVAHTHAHSDHVAGDGQFSDRPRTSIVGKDVDSVCSAFQITRWPNTVGYCDLGGRFLNVLATPGHHPTAISVYDAWTRFLLTGDTVYPGRLYVFDFPAFVDSLNRLVSFVKEKPAPHVMGSHIEMTMTPKKDYPAGTRYQPCEPRLQMSTKQLLAVRDAATSVQSKPGAHVFDDFWIFNGPCYGAMAKQL